MDTLTCSELEQYPGETATLRMQHRFEELFRTQVMAPPAPPVVPTLRKIPHGPLSVGRRIDVRRFVGRDRADRVANYLRAMVPRTATWSEESLRDVAERLVATVEIVE